MATNQPITEWRWFTLIWGHETALSNKKYVCFLIALPLMAVLAVLLLLAGTTT